MYIAIKYRYIINMYPGIFKHRQLDMYVVIHIHCIYKLATKVHSYICTVAIYVTIIIIIQQSLHFWLLDLFSCITHAIIQTGTKRQQLLVQLYMQQNSGVDLDLKKGGTVKFVIIVDVGLVGLRTLIMCEACRHTKHANTRGLGACPQKILKHILHLLRLNLRALFLVIYHPLMFLQTHAGTQKF